MTQNATAGLGTKFYRWANSQWNAVAAITAISGPSKSRTTIDVTTLDTEEGYMEFIGGLRDPGTVTLSMNFTNAGYALLNTDFESNERGNYQIVLPDDEETTLEFEALVTELPLAVEINDKITADVTFKVSGKVTLTNGASSGA